MVQQQPDLDAAYWVEGSVVALRDRDQCGICSLVEAYRKGFRTTPVCPLCDMSVSDSASLWQHGHLISAETSPTTTDKARIATGPVSFFGLSHENGTF